MSAAAVTGIVIVCVIVAVTPLVIVIIVMRRKRKTVFNFALILLIYSLHNVNKYLVTLPGFSHGAPNSVTYDVKSTLA